MTDEMMQKLALLGALHAQDNEEKNDGGDEMFVSSLGDANILLQQHMTPNGAKFRRQLVDYITNPENRVLGEGAVYHNFIMDLFRVGDYDISLKVCDFVLNMAPYNRDILADAIKACGDSSQFELGEKYLERAEKIPYDKWTFRLFLYGVDFLKTELDANPMNEGIYDRVSQLIDQYIQYFPYDEHGYNQRGELLIMTNQRDKAIQTLKRFIKNPPVQQKAHSFLVTAQCCVTLLNLLDDSTEYDDIIEFCDKGMQNTTQEQPSAAMGFFMYRKALALDAKAHACNFQNSDVVRSALVCYQSAYDLNQGRSYSKTIEQRYAILRPHVDKDQFVPLVKRPLYVTEKEAKETSLFDE